VFIHSAAEFAAWITVLVVAFEAGGASAAGLAVVVQLVPAALLAPIVAAAGDRFPRHRVLAVAFAVQASAAGGITLALIGDSPIEFVYALAAVFTVSTIATPATVASLLVHHARSPSQLMGWNVTRSFVRAAGSLAGPLLAAVVLAVAEPAAVFAGVFTACAITALLVGLRLPHDDRMKVSSSLTSVLDDSWRGVAYVASTPAPRHVVLFVGAAEMLIGALDLLFVAIAFDQLGRGGSVVALLSVGFAVGTLIAAAVASRLLHWRLSRLIGLGSLLLTLPLLVIAEVSLLVGVLALAALLGVGNGLMEIGSQTLLQRSCAETMTSRVYGALDSTSMIAAAIGAATVGALIDGGGTTETTVAVGVVGASVLLGGSVRLRSTERSLPSADPALVACLRSVSFLASLPQPTLERLGRLCEHRTVPAGAAVVVEGERGHRFYVLRSGAVEIRSDGDVVADVVAPASFGEVALLHDEVRTATVTTTSSCEFAVIHRDAFLDAIGRTATSHRDAFAVADGYRRPPEPD